MMTLITLKDNTFHSVQFSLLLPLLWEREVALEANREGQAIITLLKMQKPLLGHTLVVTPHLSVSLL